MNQALQKQLASEYQLAETTYAIAGKQLIIFNVANNYELLDKIDPDDFQKDERMPYWAEIWPASIALAEFVLTHPQFQQACCLELGSGVGVVSVAGAIAGAQMLTTDYFTEALDFAQLNASANQVAIATQWLDWRDITLTQQFDYILAADVLYEERNHAPILQAIAQLLTPSGTAYISDPQRPIAKKFLELAAEHNFQLQTITNPVAWRELTLSVDIHALSQI
ncbi:methyltransferase [Trichocoleus sp. FACHB-262]|uniref:class I SAM-dependent methyltransferase n=1 Tax=Trichocoleus sp. FACHB-262 TaxID=2692869 RepID=UPI001689D391|nr:methyltransferase domain-containing protein [Trichocoleus sp. FACHB-262]MBD2120656.1 methyltransferase domain-containing protein [Trichocoleus sp. FACHB-262]